MDNTLFDLVAAQVAACGEVVNHLGYDDGNELFRYFLSGVHGFESTENIPAVHGRPQYPGRRPVR